MEKRILNISYSKSGAGSITTRLSVPKSMLDKMGVTQENRQIELEFDEATKEITIRKAK
jgi:hypothetical protein fulcA4_13292